MLLSSQGFWGVIFFLLGTGLQLGGFQSKPVAWGCMAIGALGVCIALWEALMLPGSLITRVMVPFSLTFRRKIPLPLAARLAYEDARKNKTLWAEAAQRGADPSPEGVLDYVGTFFGMSVPIWGKHPPSTLDEVIDSTLARRGNFVGGAQRLEIRNSPEVFTDLWVRASDVRQVRKLMGQTVFPSGGGK